MKDYQNGARPWINHKGVRRLIFGENEKQGIASKYAFLFMIFNTPPRLD
jgi:hypothetical protein